MTRERGALLAPRAFALWRDRCISPNALQQHFISLRSLSLLFTAGSLYKTSTPPSAGLAQNSHQRLQRLVRMRPLWRLLSANWRMRASLFALFSPSS